MKNEAAFRAHNEHRVGLEADALRGDELLLLVCECGDGVCASRVEVTVAEYEAAREREDQFIILPGHVFPEYERAVEEHQRFAVVRKLP